MADESHKTCVRCNQSLPRSAFFSARNRPDGLYPYCRKCNSEWLQERKVKDPAAYEAHRARKRAYDAEYNQRHKAKKADQVKRRYAAKSDEIKAQVKQWQEENKDRVRAYKRTNKYRRRAAMESGVSTSALLAWETAQPKVCYWCGKRCAKKYHIDHYEPLARGGAHEISNLVIACPACNLSKQARDPFEFARQVGRLL
jgi:5-methylcytosine-specific restriction endonuclease McrA